MNEMDERRAVRGLLHVDIRGVWDVVDFQKLLADLNLVYNESDSVLYMVYRSLSRPETQDEWVFSMAREMVLHKSVAWRRGSWYSLKISAIQVASPGWIEVLGSLNPLKVIADAWVEKKRLDLERERMLLEHQRHRLDTEVDMKKFYVSQWVEVERVKLAFKTTMMDNMEKLTPKASKRAQETLVSALIDTHTEPICNLLLNPFIKNEEITNISVRPFAANPIGKPDSEQP